MSSKINLVSNELYDFMFPKSFREKILDFIQFDRNRFQRTDGFHRRINDNQIFFCT